jgi:pyruvate dehydrogenase phosphatase
MYKLITSQDAQF